MDSVTVSLFVFTSDLTIRNKNPKNSDCWLVLSLVPIVCQQNIAIVIDDKKCIVVIKSSPVDGIIHEDGAGLRLNHLDSL